MKKNVLAIDIGGSKLLVGIVDMYGNVLAKRKHVFVNPTQTSVLQAIINESEEILKEGHAIDRIGVAVPGLADAENGIWVYACFSKISNFPIAEILTEHFGYPVFIENDANICAYGEKKFGHAKEISDFLWVTVSNGVGSGIFLNNNLFYGLNGNAGEIGHVNVMDQGDICSCGNNGCLEAYAAGPAITKRFNTNTRGKYDVKSAKEVADLAISGNEEALKIFKETGYYLGTAIASTVNILNVPLVVIGGGVSMVFDLFEESLLNTIHQKLYQSANKDLQIKHTALGYEASLIGAAAYALNKNK